MGRSSSHGGAACNIAAGSLASGATSARYLNSIPIAKLAFKFAFMEQVAAFVVNLALSKRTFGAWLRSNKLATHPFMASARVRIERRDSRVHEARYFLVRYRIAPPLRGQVKTQTSRQYRRSKRYSRSLAEARTLRWSSSTCGRATVELRPRSDKTTADQTPRAKCRSYVRDVLGRSKSP